MNTITPTLIDSYKWLRDCPSSWKEKARTDFMGKLLRAPFKPTPEIQRGMLFESIICRNLNLTKGDFIALFKKTPARILEKFYDRCKGGIQQEWINGVITLDGEQYKISGKMDIKQPTYILDIKTTKTFKESKYINGSQHSFYTYFANIPHFIYLVAEFGEYDYPFDCHEIDIVIPKEQALDRIKCDIAEMMEFIRSFPEMDKAYKEHHVK